VHPSAAILFVCACAGGAAVAQVPSVQQGPIPQFREAIYLGVTTCRPDPTFEYCSKGSDRFYTILLDGKPYVLRSGPSNAQILAMLHAVVVPDSLSHTTPSRNLLDSLAPQTGVQVRFHGGSVDVRALTPSARGPRYAESHYDIALSREDRLYHRSAN